MFLLAFTKLCAQRGVPKSIISDNAKCFESAKEILERAAHKDSKFDLPYQTILSKKIKWTCITPGAPWMGVFYERLIGVVKRCLKKNLGGNSLSYGQLEALVISIEAIVNGCPLTYVGDEDERILTPTSFLLPAMLEVSTLGIMWKQKKQILESFWDTWSKEYLNSLRERDLKPKKSDRSLLPRTPALDEYVLIMENKPRFEWRVAKVKHLMRSSDGKTRSILMVDKEGNEFLRHVSRICPLEASPQIVSDQLSS